MTYLVNGVMYGVTIQKAITVTVFVEAVVTESGITLPGCRYLILKRK